MRAVLSRVVSASVVVIGEVGRGLLALVGVARTDGEDGAHEMTRMIHELPPRPAAVRP